MAKKYIDADKLKAEIERRRLQNRYIDTDGYEQELFEIIDSLQQEQPEQPTRGYDEVYLNDCIAKAKKSWEGVDVDKFMDDMRGREPEVDLEKETKRWWKEHLHLNPENQLWMDAHQSVVFARHFYELGKNSK